MQVINRVYLFVAVGTLVGFPFFALVHESVNYLLLTHFGIPARIEFGITQTNDCPWNCQPANFTSFAWTAFDPSAFIALNTSNKKLLAGALIQNESTSNQGVQFLLCEMLSICIFFLMAVKDTPKFREFWNKPIRSYW